MLLQKHLYQKDTQRLAPPKGRSQGLTVDTSSHVNWIQFLPFPLHDIKLNESHHADRVDIMNVRR